jgi:hypothetical protein
MGRRSIAVVIGAALLAACAPDSWRYAPTFNEFLRQIARECHPNAIGGMQISNLNSNAFFVNQTSRLYHGTLTPQQYVASMNAFYPGNNAAALDCILERAPQQAP